MPRYFNYFPKTPYTLQTTTDGLDVVTNIISRYSIQSNLRDNASAYYEYEIKESDTPEIIASKIYETPERHWLVLAMNNMIDPQFDWPMQYKTLINFIDTKYTANANTTAGQTGLEWAQSNTQAYTKTEKRTTNYSGNYIESTVNVDAATYANVVVGTSNVALEDGTAITIETTKTTITYYDYELETNEAKRNIKLLKPEFAYTLEQELKSIFS